MHKHKNDLICVIKSDKNDTVHTDGACGHTSYDVAIQSPSKVHTVRV